MKKTLCLFALMAAPVWAQTPPPPAPAPPPVPNYVVPIHGHGKYVPTADGRVYYETEGNGPPVFIVAGGPGGGHASFHPWFSRLAAEHTVVYFDNIGRGRSDRLKDPKGYTVQRDAEDIEALRVALGYDRISLIGHSYGGYPALAYTLKYPQHVSRLVLSDTLYGAKGFQENIDSANWNAEHAYPEVWDKLTAMRKRGVKTGTDEYEDLYGDATQNLYWYNPDNAAKLFKSGDNADGFNGDVYAAIIGDDPEWKVGGTMRGYDPEPEMRRMTTPTLICVGRYDRIATPKTAWEMHQLIPNSRIAFFDHSGHRPWLEETDAYFATVLPFLK